MPEEVFQSIATREGSVEKVPVNPNDITNKNYVDNLIIILTVGTLLATAIVIGNVVAISEVDGVLFTNASAEINGSLEVKKNLTVGDTINAKSINLKNAAATTDVLVVGTDATPQRLTLTSSGQIVFWDGLGSDDVYFWNQAGTSILNIDGDGSATTEVTINTYGTWVINGILSEQLLTLKSAFEKDPHMLFDSDFGTEFYMGIDDSLGIFGIATTPPVLWSIFATPALNIKGNDVGIFNKDPSEALDVTGNILASGTITATGNIAVTGQINLNSVGANIITATNAGGDLRLGAGGGTNDLKIDTDGNIHIFEDLTVDGIILADNVFIPKYLSVHTDVNMSLTQNEWRNVTFPDSTEIHKGIAHDPVGLLNTTINITASGIYLIEYFGTFIDTDPSGGNEIAVRVTANGNEIIGSLVEEASQKQGAEFEISDGFLANITAPSSIHVEVITDATTVSLENKDIFGEHPSTMIFDVIKIDKQ